MTEVMRGQDGVAEYQGSKERQCVCVCLLRSCWLVTSHFHSTVKVKRTRSDTFHFERINNKVRQCVEDGAAS